jgi:hypothetical protein
MSCKAIQCRHPVTHVTRAHRCGKCHTYGHGQIECSHSVKMRNLVLFYDEEMDISNHCTIPQCIYPWSHSNEAHHCAGCGVRGGENHSCTTRGRNYSSTSHKLTKKCPHCNLVSEVDVSLQLFTGTDCTICMEPTRMVIFSGCKHTNVCATCVSRLD